MCPQTITFYSNKCSKSSSCLDLHIGNYRIYTSELIRQKVCCTFCVGMTLLQDAVLGQMAASETWPDDAALFKPDQENQILINENAASLAVQAFLRMCDLNIKVEGRSNAEFMSPSGKLPVLLCGKFVISEPIPIFQFVQQKGITLSEDLSENDQQDMKAYIQLINNTLIPAELFIMWLHRDTLKQVTWKRYGHPYPWPLNHILCFRKRHSTISYLNAIGWGTNNQSLTTIDEEVRNCCAALSQKLADKKYFFGSKPTELDAMVYGHLYTIITTSLPDNRLAKTIQQFGNLVAFCQNIDRDFFANCNENSEVDS
uniref:Metaxin-2-like n=1 Tax=Phallusia mammillata TaxID=59560 RepID=A0A6F9DMC9_9ASCI|nr:metaxin-2-like [Phallusia mammillata]